VSNHTTIASPRPTPPYRIALARRTTCDPRRPQPQRPHHRSRCPARAARRRRLAQRVATSPARRPTRRLRHRPPSHTALPPHRRLPTRVATHRCDRQNSSIPAAAAPNERHPSITCHAPTILPSPRLPHVVDVRAQTLASVPPQPPPDAIDAHPNACTRTPAAPRPTQSKRNRTARSPPRCGNERDRRDRRAFGDDTTPRLKTQNGRLPQGPQTLILANYRGIATSWPFVAASTCPHDPVNAAPALTYLFNHDYASSDRTGDEDVATSSNFTERCGQPRRMFL